jgi:nucleoside-diphosphate-sugar epimerase
MKIFITGSSGFIGGELVKRLEGKHEIVSYSHDKGFDILDYNQLKKAMKGCDVVVHSAAIRKPLEDKNFVDYFNVNCIGTFNVAQAAMENGVKKLIYLSSSSYYGIEKGIPEPSSIVEDIPILTQKFKVSDLSCRDCDIAYSTSKVIAEQILANYGLTKKFQVIILRFGPTRKRGEYRPFGKLRLHLKIENGLQALESAIFTDKELWYEAFTIMDELDNVDISKAKKLLNYKPV